MKLVSTLLASAAALALASTAVAQPKPVWEVGIGAGGSYSPDYWGSDHSTFGGFPLAYLTYRGKDFSILSTGLYDVPADDKSRFAFGLSLDVQSKVDSEDRLFLPEIDYVGEVGPQITFAFFADGRSRLQASVAARAAFELGEGYVGFVIEPEVAYLAKLNSVFRAGLYVTPKFGFDGYNQLYYSTPVFGAENGYIGTEVSVKAAYDLTDRTRISGKVGAIIASGGKNEDSALYQQDVAFTARLSITYALFQSSETIDE